MTDNNFLADLFIMLEQNRVDEIRTLLREKLGTWDFHERNPDRVIVVRAPPKLKRTTADVARIEDWQYEVANGDTRLGYEEWLNHQLEAEEYDREVTRPQPVIRCTGCGNEIDPDMCHCGISYADHNDMEQGHCFVPAGCDCGRIKDLTQEAMTAVEKAGVNGVLKFLGGEPVPRHDERFEAVLNVVNEYHLAIDEAPHDAHEELCIFEDMFSQLEKIFDGTEKEAACQDPERPPKN